MDVNRDKPDLWKRDIRESVDCFNKWFMEFAPQVFKEERVKTAKFVKEGMIEANDFRNITPDLLRRKPAIVKMLRMATCPPIARDRLIGLAEASKNLVGKMEDANRLPPKMPSDEVEAQLSRICGIIRKLLDTDLFEWLASEGDAPDEMRTRAATVVADRLCGSLSDPIIRNAQEQRQLARIADYLTAKGYEQRAPSPKAELSAMDPGTYSFRTNILVGPEDKPVKLPIDAIIQPHNNGGKLPVLVEAKSAGDFTNVNKRRKEEAKKMSQLRAKYGNDVVFVLFLCGYFDTGYLGYEAAEGIDWVWEHRIEDLDKFGI